MAIVDSTQGLATFLGDDAFVRTRFFSLQTLVRSLLMRRLDGLGTLGDLAVEGAVGQASAGSSAALDSVQIKNEFALLSLHHEVCNTVSDLFCVIL